MPQDADHQQESRLLEKQRVALLGTLAGMSKRDACRLIRRHGGTVARKPDATITLVVLGEADIPVDKPADSHPFWNEQTRRAAEEGRLTTITETQLWQRLGLVDQHNSVRGLYTPAIVAELLGIPVALVRRWHRKGVIVPVREVRRLPYFDFREVATARRLADLLAAGCSPQAIEKQLSDLTRFIPSVERPLRQLSVIVEGKQLLFRQRGRLREPRGQLRFDFEARAGTGSPACDADLPAPAVVPLPRPAADAPAGATPAEMFAMAGELEEDGLLEDAVLMYRAVLSAAGPDAEVNFLLAELLYRLGDVPAARERYYAAIEADEEFIEARANLGCILAETGEPELAVAALEGALNLHPDYPDAHYHLARTLDDLGRNDEAASHWRRFLTLVPDSPWAEEAHDRLLDTTRTP